MKFSQDLKHDANKIPLAIVPTEIIWAIGKTMGYGLKKYKSVDNWQKVDIDRYKSACYRHFLKFLEDEESRDEESGLLHIEHVACNVAFIIELMKKNK